MVDQLGMYYIFKTGSCTHKHLQTRSFMDMASGGSAEVEPSTHSPTFKGSNPVTETNSQKRFRKILLHCLYLI
jgi:hypothetical protein